MAISDGQLIAWLSHDHPKVRSASLELLSNSYVCDNGVLKAIFDAWDRFGPEMAFPDFPLVSHIPIPDAMVDELLERATAMSAGRKITDRTCRCAGKLLEALSVSETSRFANHLGTVSDLKNASKIFFRVPLALMRERASALSRESSSLQMDFDDGTPENISVALECLFYRGQASKWIDRGFGELEDGASPSPLAMATLAFAARHSLPGYDQPLLGLVERSNATIADQATIALVRARQSQTHTLIAERYPKLTRSGQLRCLDIIRRTRLPKSSDLLRFLLPLGLDFQVQDATRIAEVCLFDFVALEDWLEAFLLADEKSLMRIAPLIALAKPLAERVAVTEWPRVEHLIRTRLGSSWIDPSTAEP